MTSAWPPRLPIGDQDTTWDHYQASQANRRTSGSGLRQQPGAIIGRHIASVEVRQRLLKLRKWVGVRRRLWCADTWGRTQRGEQRVTIIKTIERGLAQAAQQSSAGIGTHKKRLQRCWHLRLSQQASSCCSRESGSD